MLLKLLLKPSAKLLLKLRKPNYPPPKNKNTMKTEAGTFTSVLHSKLALNDDIGMELNSKQVTEKATQIDRCLSFF